ncbi:hypothetical protein DKY63_03590 [Pseudomonas putida]|uniref:Uncharacterized protein n=1 Tax=Pseudomonas putida TaxID=303 RepID=A0A2Z4RGG5_PSEPU|nr:hypothetical protein [Pseudomonas putida]AWY39044.1 hypothetical protein DKY63_03590 [Pseudomonas putida]
MRPLSDQHVYEIAAEIGGTISDYLNDHWYTKSGMQLSIRWSFSPRIEASASAYPSLENPSQHVIDISYAFVKEIYDQAVDFALFATGGDKAHPLGVHLIPAGYKLFEAAELMFQFGLTFVIFHELGHLNQSHGAIRAKYTGNIKQLTLAEFQVNGHEKLAGDQSAIYHATELAADFEALDWMCTFLQRDYQGEEFLDLAYLQCASVSCMMLLFNGDQPVRLDKQPIGSHPYPVVRMDLWVQAYAERIRTLAVQLEIETPYPEIYKRMTDAAFVTLLKWMTRLQLPNVPEYSGHSLGSLTHPNFSDYMKSIIEVWSKEYVSAREFRKYGMPLAVLYFTDEFRQFVGAELNTESLLQHVRSCLITQCSN